MYVCTYVHMYRCRYISTVQQALASKTQTREKELDRAKQYFEVLHLNPQVCARVCVCACECVCERERERDVSSVIMAWL